MTASPRTLSVLIPTLGRENEPIATVQALLRQTRVPDEIVVVDRNGGALPGLDRFLDGNPIIKHLKSPAPGVAASYNRALEAATGEIVLFVDDDVVPDSRLVEMHLENYASHPRIGAVAGRVEQPTGDRDPATIGEMGVYHRWTGVVSGYFNATRRREVEIAPGGNMSFVRAHLLEIGGFDEGFEGNGRFFETDGSLRFSEAGNPIVFDPRARLQDLRSPTGGARIEDRAQRVYYDVRNGIRLCRRHSPALALPVCFLRLMLYAGLQALTRGDPRIFSKAMQGLADGISQSMELQTALGK